MLLPADLTTIYVKVLSYHSHQLSADLTTIYVKVLSYHSHQLSADLTTIYVKVLSYHSHQLLKWIFLLKKWENIVFCSVGRIC
jgi:hypothetical protein